MAGQNGLQFEIGVRNEQAVKALKALQKDALVTGEGFDTATKALDNMIKALARIGEVKNRVKGAVFSSKGLGLDTSYLRSGLKELEALEKKLKSINTSGGLEGISTQLKLLTGADFGILLKGLTQAAKEQENVNKATEKQIALQQKMSEAERRAAAANTEANRRKLSQMNAVWKENVRQMGSLMNNATSDQVRQAASSAYTIAKTFQQNIQRFLAGNSPLLGRKDLLTDNFFGLRGDRAVEAVANAKRMSMQDKRDIAGYDKVEKFIQKLDVLKQKMEALNKQRVNIGLGADTNTIAQIEAAINKLRQLQTSSRIGDASYVNGRLNGASMTRDLGGWNTAYRKNTAEMNAATAALRKQEQAAMESARAEENLARTMQRASEAAKQQGRIFSEMRNWAQMYFSFYGAKDLLQSIIQVGGEFEVQHIALQNIIGDLQQGTQLYNEIKELSVESPFTFSQLTSNTRQLSAYAIPYDELFDTTKRLSDLSAGLGVDFYRIALAYGQIRSASVLRGQELRQLTEAGIPMVQALADKFTALRGEVVTTNDVLNKLIPGKEVPFEMVKEVLWDMTGESGRFYNMQFKLSDTLAGKWSNLKDAWEIMLSDLAKGSSATGTILKGVVEGITALVRNASVLSGVMMSFGALKMGQSFLNGAQAGRSNSAAIMKGHNSYVQSAVAAQVTDSRKLSQIERDMLANKGKIVASEAKILVGSQMLTKQDALRLGLQGKLTRGSVQYLATQGLITSQQQRQILNGGWMSKQMTLLSLKARAVGSAIGGWFKANIPMLAISLITGAIFHIVNKSKEATARMQELAQSLTEKAKKLQEEYAKIGSSDGIGMREMRNGIDEMIKSLSEVGSSFDTNETKTHAAAIKTLAERYDYLAEKMRLARDAAQSIASEPTIVSNASEAMNDLGDELKDFDESESRLSKARGNLELYRKNLEVYIKQVTAANPKIAKALSGLTVEEQVGKVLEGKTAGQIKGMPWQIRDYKAALDDFKKQVQDVNAEASKGIGAVITTAMGTEAYKNGDNAHRLEIIRQAFNAAVDGIEEGSVRAKDAVKGIKSEELKRLQEFAKTFAKGGKKAVDEATDYLVGKLAQGWNFQKLDKYQQMEVQKFVDGAVKKYKLAGDNVKAQIEATKIIARLMVEVQPVFKTPDGTELDDYAKEVARMGTRLRDGKILLNGKTYDERSFAYTFNGGYEAVQKRLVERYQSNQEQKKRIALLKGGDYKTSEEANNKKDLQDIMAQWNTLYPGADIDQFTSTGKFKKDPKGSHEDKQLKYWRQRMQQIEKLKSLFDKYAEEMSEKSALDEVRKSGMSYAALLPDHVDTKDAFDAWQKSQYETLRKSLKASSEERRTLLDDTMLKEKDYSINRLKEQINDIMERTQKAIQEGTSRWNLFKGIRDKLGANVARVLTNDYGVIKSDVIRDNIEYSLQDYIRTTGASPMSFDTLLGMVKNGQKSAWKSSGYNDGLWKMFEDYISQLRSEENEKIDLVVQAMEETRNSYERLQQEVEKAERTKVAIDESHLSDQEKEKAKLGIDALLSEKRLQFSGTYSNFYTNFLSMTAKQAKEAGNAIKQNLKDRLDAGVISAKAYAEEMKKIKDQCEKIDETKSDWQAFLEGGFEGKYKNQYDRYEAEYNKANEDYGRYSQQYNAALGRGDKNQANYYQGMMGNAKSQAADAFQGMGKAKGRGLGWAIADKIVHTINNGIQALAKCINNISDAITAMGGDIDPSSAWGEFSAYANGAAEFSDNSTKGFESLKDGDYAGAVLHNISAVASVFKNAAQHHDNKLDYQIKLAEERNTIVRNLKENLEKNLERTLGGIYNTNLNDYERSILSEIANSNASTSSGDVFSKAYGYIREAVGGILGGGGDDQVVHSDATKKQAQKALDTNSYYEAQLAQLMAQRDNVQTQLSNEEDKKNKDRSKIEDYKQSIRDLDDQVQNFASDMAKALYDIDVKSWASQLGDALFDAWQKGTNAVDAYKGKLQELVAQTAKNIVTTRLLEAAMNKPVEWLIGRMETQNGKLYEQDILEFSKQIGEATDGVIPALFGAYDALESGLNKDSMTMKETGSASGGNVIRGITEDQADILISYINGMRADLSLHVQDLRDLMERTMPDMSRTFEAQLAQLKSIEENTRRSADASEEIRDVLNSVVMGVKKLSVR